MKGVTHITSYFYSRFTIGANNVTHENYDLSAALALCYTFSHWNLDEMLAIMAESFFKVSLHLLAVIECIIFLL